ncbi:hypothetical protein Tsp_05424 [Trichinella spiralis]|uniref:hypothetical protein n=1 Tax=Trichinella spiralis TaxID=6334 RepID=UPI0001EFD564|nr:hypothetical protein Tsp_05424 [Trichinella spiralis]
MFVSLTVANCQQQYCNLNYWENGVREMSNDGIGVNYELAWGVVHPGMVVIRRAVHGESWSRAVSGVAVVLSTGYLYPHSKRTNKQTNKQTVENKFDNTLDGSVASTGSVIVHHFPPSQAASARQTGHKTISEHAHRDESLSHKLLHFFLQAIHLLTKELSVYGKNNGKMHLIDGEFQSAVNERLQARKAGANCSSLLYVKFFYLYHHPSLLAGKERRKSVHFSYTLQSGFSNNEVINKKDEKKTHLVRSTPISRHRQHRF